MLFSPVTYFPQNILSCFVSRALLVLCRTHPRETIRVKSTWESRSERALDGGNKWRCGQKFLTFFQKTVPPSHSKLTFRSLTCRMTRKWKNYKTVCLTGFILRVCMSAWLSNLHFPAQNRMECLCTEDRQDQWNERSSNHEGKSMSFSSHVYWNKFCKEI